MTNYIYILGTAGSGKSTLTSVLENTIDKHKRYALTVNLDPGAEDLPYNPIVDIRNFISLGEVMRKYKLGPNGALIVATDLIVNYLSEIKKIIEDENPDYVIIDTPGQLELFAYRDTGIRVLNTFSRKNSLILFLLDSFLAQRSNVFASLLLLSSSIQARFLLPYLLVLSKTDLIEESKIETITEWSEDLSKLEEDIQNEPAMSREIYLNLVPVLSNLFIPSLIPVSATTRLGILELYGSIERVFGTEDEFSSE
ncbi:MAG: ATP/GTP-binding protein [Thermoproteota archaeon]|jgi:GTPase SAR1 and related small G proteins